MRSVTGVFEPPFTAPGRRTYSAAALSDSEPEPHRKRQNISVVSLLNLFYLVDAADISTHRIFLTIIEGAPGVVPLLRSVSIIFVKSLAQMHRGMMLMTVDPVQGLGCRLHVVVPNAQCLLCILALALSTPTGLFHKLVLDDHALTPVLVLQPLDHPRSIIAAPSITHR